MTSYSLVDSYQSCGKKNTEDGGRMLLRNGDIHLPDLTVS
jgi:hypothetical protein